MAGRTTRSAAPLAVALGLLLSLAAPANGAVTVGRDTAVPGTGNTGCGPAACTIVSREPEYVIPSSGILVRWRVFTMNGTGDWRIRTISPIGMDGSSTGTGTGGFESVPPGGEQVFDARLPVTAGDLLALDGPLTATAALRFDDGGTGNSWRPPLTDGETPRLPNGGFGGFTPLYNADVEPDADGDFFGDETQDRCPAQATTQGPCVPETTITKAPKRKLHKPKAKVKFISDQAAATFECKLDKRKFKRCTSPRKLKRLKEGKHRFRVRAINEGVRDPTAAKAKFKVELD